VPTIKNWQTIVEEDYDRGERSFSTKDREAREPCGEDVKLFQ